MKNLALLAAILFALPTHVFSQEKNSFSPEIKRVAVFKNGFAFTYREGETRVQNGWAYSKNTPIGVLGTIWGYSTTPNVKVKQLLTTQIENRGTERVVNLPEILIANEGARIRFLDYYNGNKSVEGTYEILSDNRKFIRTASNSGNNLTIALKTETGVMFFPISSIRNLEILGKPTYSKPKITKENRLKIKVDGVANGSKAKLGIAALERGIRWIPAYRVELKGTPVKEAKLELEAMLINELADLENTEIFFVVGVPHFLFSNMISPLSMNTAFAGVSSYFQPSHRGGSRNLVSNAIMTQVFDEKTQSPSIGDSPTIIGEEQANSFSAEQLYLYQTKHINLKKNERTSLRLFSLTVPAKEVFKWDVNDASDTQNRYLNYSRSSNRNLFKQNLSDKIWYSIRLRNQTGMPWTTAPALSFRDWKPLGQDMLTFTPKNGENILRITPATEVIGTHSLEEVSREQTSLSYDGRNRKFDLVTVEGKLNIRNFKKESVEVVISRKLVGEVVSADNGGKIAKDGLNLQAINPKSNIKWSLNAPNGMTELKYTFKIYVKR